MNNSNDPNSLLCPECDTEIRPEDLIEQLGDIETYRCPTCGNIITFTVSHLHDIPRLEGLVTLTIYWKDKRVSSKEIMALRSLFPSYQEMPITELKKVLQDTENLRITNLSRGEAEDLVRKARQRGLDVTIEPESGL